MSIAKQLMGPVYSAFYFYLIFLPTMEVNGVHELFGYLLQNIFFCVQQKKEIHAGLEQLE